MNKILIMFCLSFFISKSCVQSIEEKTFQESVELHLDIKKMDDCHFFCYFLEVTITNNNKNGIYMPFFDGYDLIDVYNDKDNNITSNIMMYESLNKQSNYGLKKEDTELLKKIDSLENVYDPFKNRATNFKEKILDNIFKEDLFTYYVSKSKLQADELNNLPDFTKNTIREIKYGSIAFVPAYSSRKLFVPINYLYQNFVVEGYPIKPFYGTHGTLEEEEIFKHNYSNAWEDYETVKTNKVKIIFRYDLDSLRDGIMESSDSIIIPISYEKEGNDSIVITKKYPKKLLNKFSLLKRIKSDTLELDLSGH